MSTYKKMKVTELCLPDYTQLALREAKITTVGQLLKLTEQQLRQVPQIGQKSIDCIKDELFKRVLYLRKDCLLAALEHTLFTQGYKWNANKLEAFVFDPSTNERKKEGTE